MLLVIDYSYIELVTLAAVCIQHYGRSRLAEVIRRGIDPHAYTAAMITGMTLESFMSLKKSDPHRFKDLRQKAKALNFGLPGGLGVDSFIAYARDNYGVELSKNEAEAWRKKVIEDIYPELSLYLADQSMQVLATRFGCSVDDLWKVLSFDGQRPGWMPHSVRRILSGSTTKKDGSPYSPLFLDRVWSGLAQCCRDEEIRKLLMTRRAGPRLEMLFDETAVTPTGRVRAGVGYTEARNTPFQAMASDGAKLAAFKLIMAGFRVVAFIHDEFVIELPIDAEYYDEADYVDQIVRQEMSRAIDDKVPVKAEFAFSTCWSKSAELLRNSMGKIVPWSPK